MLKKNANVKLMVGYCFYFWIAPYCFKSDLYRNKNKNLTDILLIPQHSTVLISLAILYNDQELLEDTFYPWIRSPPDLHPPGLQVVDIKDFQFLINNNICNQTQISLVTIVSSAIPHKVG